MEPEQARMPMLTGGRGGVLIADFCLNTGLDRAVVEDLVRTGRLEGGLSTRQEPMYSGVIYDDALPSRDELVAMGVPVRDDYDPHALRYGGIECQTHGWAQSVLLTRHDAGTELEVPDRDMCWECSRAGVPPDGHNSTPIESARVERWVEQTLARRSGTWPGDDQ
jgi:hypothetical protein